jgi:hypothetical protein
VGTGSNVSGYSESDGRTMGKIVTRRKYGTPRKNLVDELVSKVPGMTAREACTLMCIAAGLGDIQVWFPPYVLYIQNMRLTNVMATKPDKRRSVDMRLHFGTVAGNSEQR